MGDLQEDPFGNIFHKVIPLNEEKHEWEMLHKNMPSLPRGWFELSRLEKDERLEFTRDFWLSKLLFTSGPMACYEHRLQEFFENLEDIEIYATQMAADQPFELHMIYSLKNAAGFFQGMPPASPEKIATLEKQFAQINFPPDYLAFLEIHDGYSKYTDTGVLQTKQIAKVYQQLQEMLSKEVLVRPDGQVINPSSLIPFYESFGLHSYQCFYTDWFPEEEVGNVYFSEHDRTISNFLNEKRLEENLAFSSFLGWLVFYLEDIWHL